ncbi:hypothetical protein [Pseudanabaena sp. FACHB-2040]|uniref:hypothetical protein n=1 Tax=Pseudanabaena sp. FACHB-2040 TaxID=2692859 RepID=UPI001685A0B3|nr:hypothetical protein [Pseudanabaena sp. FACHB-2040]MBD2259889.1 hypothetical protein [Pseudanabaena sp. FACHB-2040]
MGYVPPIPKQPKPKLPVVLTTLLGASFLGAVWAVLFATNLVTLGGIPYSVLMTFWQDPIARNAYLGSNDEVLHNRISELGIEAAIKAYHRPKMGDSNRLDQLTHQILYNHTGYIGEAYQVSDSGRLVPRDSN